MFAIKARNTHGEVVCKTAEECMGARLYTRGNGREKKRGGKARKGGVRGRETVD